jgi:zinc/manganese transport system substrate-binding protein
MKTIFLIACITIALASTARAKLNVVATTPDLGAIAKEIGGDRIDLTTLAKPTEDPHFVDARPSFIVKLNHADALIEGGAELELGWLPPLLEQARNPKLEAGKPGRILCVHGIHMLEVPSTLDRSRGDIHAAGNPHFMTDPQNGKIAAERITDALCRLDPNSTEVFRANLKKFELRLDAKLAEWQKVLAPHKGKRVVTYHNSWPYFAQRFDLRMDLFLEPTPGIPPTPSHLAEVVERMKADRIHVIAVEPHVSRKTAESVAGRTGAVVVEFTQYPGGAKGTEAGYIEMMDYLVRTLAKAFEEKK